MAQLDLQPINDNSPTQQDATPPMSMAPNQTSQTMGVAQAPETNNPKLDLQPMLDLQPLGDQFQQPDSVIKNYQQNGGNPDKALGDYVTQHSFKSILQPLSQSLTGQSAEEATNAKIQADAANIDFRGMNADQIQDNLEEVHEASLESAIASQIADILQTPATYLGEPLFKGAGALASKIPVAGTNLGDIASKVQLKNPLTAQGWHDMASQVQQLSGKSLDDTINQTINEGINRGIRPSVSGKQTPVKSAQFDTNATAAIKDLVSNKDKVNIEDNDGNSVDLNQGGVRGLMQGVQQRMNQLVQDWQGLASKTDQAAITIDAKPYIAKLNDLMGDTGTVDANGNPILTKEGQIFQTEHPADFNKVESIRDGLQLRGQFTPTDLLDKIQEWNADLAPKYKSGFQYGSNRAVNVVRDLTSDMRSDLDDAITSSTGEEFQPLRTMWGSYKSLLKDVTNRAIVAGRANPKGIWNLLDSAGNAEMFSGAFHTVTGNPLVGIPSMLKGGVLKISKNLIEKANNPNEIVNTILSKTDQLMTKKASIEALAVKNGIPPIDTPYSKPEALTPEVMGGKALPAPSPKIGINRALPSPTKAGQSSGPVINQEGYVPLGLPEGTSPTARSGVNVPAGKGLPSPREAGQSSGPVINQPPEPGQVAQQPKLLPKPETTYGEGFTMKNYKSQPIQMSDSDKKDLADMLDWTHNQQKGERYTYVDGEGQRQYSGTPSAHAQSVQEAGPQNAIHMMQKALLDKPLNPMQTLKINKMLKDYQTNIKPKITAEASGMELESDKQVEGNTKAPENKPPIGPNLWGNEGKAFIGDDDAKKEFLNQIESQLKGTGLEGGSSVYKNNNFVRKNVLTSSLESSIVSKEQALDRDIVSKWEDKIKSGKKPTILTHTIDGKTEVVDGAHKWQAYKNLGIKKVPTIDANTSDSGNKTMGMLGPTAAASTAIGASLGAKKAVAAQPDVQDRLKLPAAQYTKREEGFRGSVYKDTTGHKTVGYGFNLDDTAIRRMIPNDVLSGKRELTIREAESIFSKAYTKAQNDATDFVGARTWGKLSPGQQKALSDMSYNLGSSKLNDFSHMKLALQSGNWQKASAEVLKSHYAKEVPNRAQRNSELMKANA